MSVIQFTPAGIYCPAGDFYIDPWQPVKRAVITHAHSDHARADNNHYLATPLTSAVMSHRLGAINVQELGYATPLRIGSATVSLHPAGHVPGSAQIRIDVGGKVAVISGDYKLENDGLSTPFEPVQCHEFVSECTFGLPVFHWPNQSDTIADIVQWWRENRNLGKITVLTAYGLGKAQRIINALPLDIGPIYCHSAIENTNQVLRGNGLALRQTTRLTPDVSANQAQGALIIVPPSATDIKMMQKLGARSVGFASGWMALRGIRRRRGFDRGFVMSDHADWPALNTAIAETGAEKVYVTHGYTDVFCRWLTETGHTAQVVPTQFGESEEGE